MGNAAKAEEMVKVTKENELDLVQGLLEAADFRNDDDLQTEIQIKRNDKVFFKFKVRPLSEEELVKARRNDLRLKKISEWRSLPHGKSIMQPLTKRKYGTILLS